MRQRSLDYYGSDEMTFWDKILETEQNIRKRVENAFGKDTSQTPLEVRRQILEQVETRIVVDKGGKVFPYGKIELHLHPSTKTLHDVFEVAFVSDDSLKSDISQRLQDAQIREIKDFQILIEFHEPAGESGELFHLNFLKSEPSQPAIIPESTLTVLKGSVEKETYILRKERILIGRLSEVTDLEGRMVRKNDVAFLDNGDDINSTVGRIHARIWFDSEKEEFRIMDEASRYGTRIVRDGRSIEAPSGNSRGIRLKSGDEIYLGQACVRFELKQP
jgi:hypothetical protein